MVNVHTEPSHLSVDEGNEESAGSAVVDVEGLTRRYGSRTALLGVDFQVERGEVHALLGPNGAGKTTLLRTLCGLLQPDDGEVWIHGLPWEALAEPKHRALLGLAPSGDRSFYLRLSGLENLTFFARLHGLRRKDALARAWACLREVGLVDEAKLPVSAYSHGMQKRLSFARAILGEPPVLMIDEATHDLDPPGAERIRQLTRERAAAGAAVVWATQRVDEIRGFADRVTLLHQGQVRFVGSVPELMATAPSRAYVLQLEAADRDASSLGALATVALHGMGQVTAPREGGVHYLLTLDDDVILGDAIAGLQDAGISVLACREERSQVELAFLLLTGETT